MKIKIDVAKNNNSSKIENYKIVLPISGDLNIEKIVTEIKNASTRWTMSIKDWGLAVNQFAILFDGRVPCFN